MILSYWLRWLERNSLRNTDLINISLFCVWNNIHAIQFKRPHVRSEKCIVKLLLSPLNEMQPNGYYEQFNDEHNVFYHSQNRKLLSYLHSIRRRAKFTHEIELCLWPNSPIYSHCVLYNYVLSSCCVAWRCSTMKLEAMWHYRARIV